MPLKIDNWLAQQKGDDWRDTDLATVRAGDVGREIGDDSTSITLRRAGSAQDAQTVRLLPPSLKARDVASDGGEAGMVELVILGESDFDCQYGDTFVSGGLWYEVFYLVPGLTGRVEAWARQAQ